MNPPPEIRSSSRLSDKNAAEKTLRLIASLPAPEGLADRVHAGLRSAPRTPSILSWPYFKRHTGAWTRGAAAAALVFAVAGGGWGVYSRVPIAPTGKVIPMPLSMGASRGFSTGGARRVPQTLVGPVLVDPTAPGIQTNSVHTSPAWTKSAPAGPVQLNPLQTKAVPAKAVQKTASGRTAAVPVVSKRKAAAGHVAIPVH